MIISIIFVGIIKISGNRTAHTAHIPSAFVIIKDKDDGTGILVCAVGKMRDKAW